MVGNLARAGANVVAFDRDAAAVEALAAASTATAVVGAAASVTEIAQQASVVLTALPDDAVLRAVSNELLPALAARGGGAVHVSCSTVAPSTTRALAEAHAAQGVGFVSAPVFA